MTKEGDSVEMDDNFMKNEPENRTLGVLSPEDILFSSEESQRRSDGVVVVIRELFEVMRENDQKDVAFVSETEAKVSLFFKKNRLENENMENVEDNILEKYFYSSVGKLNGSLGNLLHSTDLDGKKTINTLLLDEQSNLLVFLKPFVDETEMLDCEFSTIFPPCMCIGRKYCIKIFANKDKAFSMNLSNPFFILEWRPTYLATVGEMNEVLYKIWIRKRNLEDNIDISCMTAFVALKECTIVEKNDMSQNENREATVVGRQGNVKWFSSFFVITTSPSDQENEFWKLLSNK